MAEPGAFLSHHVADQALRERYADYGRRAGAGTAPAYDELMVLELPQSVSLPPNDSRGALPLAAPTSLALNLSVIAALWDYVLPADFGREAK